LFSFGFLGLYSVIENAMFLTIIFLAMRRNFQLFSLAKDEIQSLIASDELEQASKLLEEVVEIFEKGRFQEAILISRGIKKLQKDQILGIIDYSSALEEGNRLSLRIMALLNSLSPRSQAVA